MHFPQTAHRLFFPRPFPRLRPALFFTNPLGSSALLLLPVFRFPDDPSPPRNETQRCPPLHCDLFSNTLFPPFPEPGMGTCLSPEITPLPPFRRTALFLIAPIVLFIFPFRPVPLLQISFLSDHEERRDLLQGFPPCQALLGLVAKGPSLTLNPSTPTLFFFFFPSPHPSPPTHPPVVLFFFLFWCVVPPLTACRSVVFSFLRLVSRSGRTPAFFLVPP